MTDTILPTAPPVPLPPGRVEVRPFGNQAFTVTMRGHALVTDQPLEAGGDDNGPTPVELFVVSLAACVAHYAGRFLERHHLDRERLAVTAEFTMADDLPARVTAVHLRITVPPELSAARLGALRAVVDHCTVHNTLRHTPRVTLEFD